jgi:hypothetical protein
MSKVNVARAVENIRSVTTVYTAIVEVVVNAIQAIEAKNEQSGVVEIRAIRDAQLETDGSLAEIKSVEVQDNGIGFTKAHRDSFDTLYTDMKLKDGGKGFGRFTWLKYFDDVRVSSRFKENGKAYQRTFKMGKNEDIIIDEVLTPSPSDESGSIVRLEWLKPGRVLEKRLDTVARTLVEKLLPYFITTSYSCPRIVLSESDGSDTIVLNDFFTNQLSESITEIQMPDLGFSLPGENPSEYFLVRLFKFYAPKNLKSRISLVAHQREVLSTPLHNYVPEFSEDFYDKPAQDGAARNYIVKAYVFSDYLDRHVSLERSGFDLPGGEDIFTGVGENDVEKSAAQIAKRALGEHITIRQQKKQERVQTYVDENAPWHKALLANVDLSNLPYNPSSEEIELRLQKEKFRRDQELRQKVDRVLAGGRLETLKDGVARLVDAITESSRNDLVHYIALRRNVLDLFGKSLELNEDGSYNSEGYVHDIIFPRKGDTEITAFQDHNLWIIDERLNFTSYVSSDVPLNVGGSDRPDLAVYDKRILFRGDNEPSNPITIFEFKKPQREDFVNASAKEDPVQQLIRYVNSIRDGKYKTPQGRTMLVQDNTPFYGYVVCDLTPKVAEWLRREKNFKVMPDALGWFQWFENINLYVEILSWDKLFRDASLRNKVFFHKLGII